jgi:hypothetical protein
MLFPPFHYRICIVIAWNRCATQSGTDVLFFETRPAILAGPEPTAGGPAVGKFGAAMWLPNSDQCGDWIPREVDSPWTVKQDAMEIGAF